MHTESEIRRAVKILLEAYGQLNTSEIKEHLKEVLVYDEEDLTPSPTRGNETKIVQRIGNIVSHMLPGETVHYYDEGFLVDRSVNPAIWIATKLSENKPIIIDEKEVTKRRKRIGTHSTRKYRKINWDEVNERQTTIGTLGEEFVLQKEQDKIHELFPTQLDRLQHLSAMQGDGFGYDILSLDNVGNTLFIEVKTTTSTNEDTPFYMSINEKSFFEENINNNAVIYRVYNFNPETREGLIKIITAKELFDDYIFDPISFKVTRK